MNSAQGDREFIAHLESHRPRLSKSQVVGISGASPADQTGLRCHEFEVGFIAESTRFTERQLAFINFGGRYVGLLMN